MKAGLVLRKQGEAISRKHWNAQRLLEPLPVVIPFADQITFPSSWMRTRRDHARFLNLIEVSAFLHQYQRERDSGAIVASVADYATAYALAGEVLKDTLQDLKKPLRETFEQIRQVSLKTEGAPLTRSTIREALALPDSTVRRWLTELVELEYLETETAKQGKAARYLLTGRIPKENIVLGLLTPEDLASRLPTSPTSPNFAKRVWRG